MMQVTDSARFGARRSHIVEAEGSHMIMISQLKAVTDTIMKALHTVA